MFHQRIEPAPPPAVARRPSLLVRLWRAWRAARRRRRTLAQLAALDDRLLRDIGLQRDDLRDPDFDPVTARAGRVARSPADPPVGPAARRREARAVDAPSASSERRPAAAPQAGRGLR